MGALVGMLSSMLLKPRVSSGKLLLKELDAPCLLKRHETVFSDLCRDGRLSQPQVFLNLDCFVEHNSKIP